MVGVAKYIAKVGGLCFAAGLSLTFGGCAAPSPDPAPVGRFRATPAVNVILDSLGAADEPGVAWKNAEDPKPQDIIPVKSDGTLRPGDTVRVSVFELLQEGLPATNDYIVSDVGKISLPEVGPVQAGGLTEPQVEEEIKRLLHPAILKNPSVSVTRIHSQPQMFAVLGVGVTQPGRYALPNEPFRLVDALAVARGLTSNANYVYVVRSEQISSQDTGLVPTQGIELIEPQTNAPTPKPAGEAIIPPGSLPSNGIPQPSQPAEKFENRQEMLDLITPSAKAKPKAEDESPKTGNRNGLRDLSSKEADVSASVLPGGFRLLMPPKSPDRPGPSREQVVQSFAEFGIGRPAPAASMPRDVQWVFQDGQWVPVAAPGSQRADTDESTSRPMPDLLPAEPTRNPQPTRSNPQTPAVSPPAATPDQKQAEWIFQDGRWVQIRTGQPEAAKPLPQTIPVGSTLPMDKGKLTVESESDLATQTRLIKVPVDRLLAGDKKYNVIIKPGDVIHVPADVVGEFYITGNVVRSGPFSMTGRSMTLRQAIAVAGGFKSLAWPRHCEIVRRIGLDREQTVMVDLDKILKGERPDEIIKPNDLINVGAYPSTDSDAGIQPKGGS